MATLKDIANKLNVSITTVSWVLSGQGSAKGISVEMQEKVRKYAKSLNYQPNLLARSLNTGTSRTIGLLIPSISDIFYSSIAKSVESEAEQLGYSLMICSSESELERENRMIKMLRAKQVDGIIMAPTKQSKIGIESFIKENYPFVLFDRFYSDLDTNYVIIDNEYSSYRLVKHLIDKGCRKIAILTTNPHLETLRMRYDGYKKALLESGLEINPDLYGLVEYTDYENKIVQVLDQILKKNPDVDGFFFATHILAIETFCYFHDNHMTINERFGLACIHETSTFRILAPQMNIARMPTEAIGRNSVRILHDNIEGRKSNQVFETNKMILPCRLKLH